MKEVQVGDELQSYYYKTTEPAGQNFDPEFKPHLTPEEMLQLGVFGGVYFSETPREFPKGWFTGVHISSDAKPQKDLNLFGVNASQSRKIWQEKGWIHKDDPRGWFQWYCRYYVGRRHPDDERQIKRWKNMIRHATQVINNCKTGDIYCRPKQRQALLHWAYDSRKF